MPEGKGAGWVVGQLVLFAAIALAPRELPPLAVWPESVRRPAFAAGLVLGFIGLLFGGAGSRHLGPNITIFPRPKEDGTLVEGGIYGLVRHPIYSGVLLVALGLALARASSPSLLLALVLGIFLDRKAAREEQWLLAQFPTYASYRQRVRKLIPWVY